MRAWPKFWNDYPPRPEWAHMCPEKWSASAIWHGARFNSFFRLYFRNFNLSSSDKSLPDVFCTHFVYIWNISNEKNLFVLDTYDSNFSWPEFSFWYKFLKKQWIFMCSTTTRGNLDKGKSGLSNQTNWNNYERGFKICKNKDFSCSQSKVSNRRHIKGRSANRRLS